MSFGHIDSGTPALLLHMARDAETVGSGDVCVVCKSKTLHIHIDTIAAI